MCRCDADPVALAKYVVALLRKEKPKSALKDLCIDQLEVFLSKGVVQCVLFCIVIGVTFTIKSVSIMPPGIFSTDIERRVQYAWL